jgi:hypothetical protein
VGGHSLGQALNMSAGSEGDSLRKHISSWTTLLAVGLVSMSLADTQVAAGPEMPTGDVWQSDAGYVHLPMLGADQADDESPWHLPPSDAAVLRAYRRARYEPGARHHLPLVRLRNSGHAHRGSAADVQVVMFRCVFSVRDQQMRGIP